MYYLMAVGWQKFQHVFFVVLIIKSYKHVKIFLTNDFYQCHSLMNEKKQQQLAITFYEVKVKEKELTFLSATLQKKFYFQ